MTRIVLVGVWAATLGGVCARATPLDETRRFFEGTGARLAGSPDNLAIEQKVAERFAASGLDSLQLRGLDRLLWVFLRLLFTHHSLSRFLEETNPDVIQKDIERTEKRLANMDPENKSTFQEKIRRTLEDNLKTCHDRLANYHKARENLEFVDLEIGRLENKIKSLAELAINRQEPDYISSQIDQVASSMLDTEQTMNDLDFATGLSEIDDVVPQLLEQTQ